MNKKGLLVPLSPNEETTLRRITYGLVAPSDLNKRDVGRLTSLGLVMARGNSFALTPLGEQRVAQLPNNARVPQTAVNGWGHT
jgi:hypothetical protein